MRDCRSQILLLDGPSTTCERRRREVNVIDGLKIQMSAEELALRLSERANWNDATADEYERQLRRRPAERDDPRMPDQLLELESEQHRGRAATLRLLRDHLVPGGIYLLAEQDLQFADLVPEFGADMRMAPLPMYDEHDVQ
jgi:hypothetical protein